MKNNKPTPAYEKLVALLMKELDATGKASFYHHDLVKALGCSHSTIVKSVRRLRADTESWEVKSGNGVRDNLVATPTEYRFLGNK